MSGSTPRGNLHLEVIRAPRPPLSLAVALEHGIAQPGQPAEVKAWKRENEEHFSRGLRDLEMSRRMQAPILMGALWLNVHHEDGDLDLGLVSARVVTTAGVNYIVDAFQNLQELENLRYHALGTGTAAEATTDTGLGTELTTQYTTSNVRPTGTLAEGASGNIFQTVATISVKSAAAVTEHGVLSQAAVPGGTLLDRSVFAVVNLAANEAMTATYELTFTAGG